MLCYVLVWMGICPSRGYNPLESFWVISNECVRGTRRDLGLSVIVFSQRCFIFHRWQSRKTWNLHHQRKQVERGQICCETAQLLVSRSIVLSSLSITLISLSQVYGSTGLFLKSTSWQLVSNCLWWNVIGRFLVSLNAVLVYGHLDSIKIEWLV